jgi:WD40 repeat protein
MTLLLTFLIAFTTSHAEGMRCSQLFGTPPAIMDLHTAELPQDRSLLRFDPPLEKSNATDALSRYWLNKLNKPVLKIWDYKRFLRFNDETHNSFFFSKDRRFIISKSSKNVVRIYDSQSKKQVAQIDEYLSEDLQSMQIEIIAASHNQFALAIEDGSRIAVDEHNGIKRFFPSKLIVFDYFGQARVTLNITQVLKRVEISQNEDTLYIMEADHFHSYNLSQNRANDKSILADPMLAQHLSGKHFVFQTFRVFPEQNLTVLGLSYPHGKVSAVIVAKSDPVKKSIVWTKEYDLPLEKIYKLDIVDNSIVAIGQLHGSPTLTELITPL